MKKIILITVATLFAMNVNAQDKSSKGLQGTWWVGGQVAFGKSEAGVSETKTNTFVPIVGYFVAPDITLGLGVGVLGSKTDNTTTSTTTAKSSTFIVQPLVRKYWGLGGKFYFFGQASLPVTFSKDKISDDKTTSVALDVAPGFDFIINKWITVETSFSLFNLNSTTYKPNSGNSTSNFNLNFNPFDVNPSNRDVGGLRVGVKFLF